MSYRHHIETARGLLSASLEHIKREDWDAAIYTFEAAAFEIEMAVIRARAGK